MAKKSKSSNSGNAMAQALSEILADTYVLRLRTQSVHWNIEGPLFFSVHTLTEQLYNELALAADELAERIRALGAKAPASYKVYDRLTVIDGDAIEGSDKAMVKTLIADNEKIADRLAKAIELAGEAEDDATQDMLIARKQAHDKTIWMLRATTG